MLHSKQESPFVWRNAAMQPNDPTIFISVASLLVGIFSVYLALSGNSTLAKIYQLLRQRSEL
jgi:hypothetical protein